MKSCINPTSPLAQALHSTTYESNRQRLRDLLTTPDPDAKPRNSYAKIVISHRGESLTLGAWAKRLQVPRQTVVARYKRGLRGEALLSTNMWGSLERSEHIHALRVSRAEIVGKLPNYTNLHITYNGETHTLKEWAGLLSLSYPMLQARYKEGKTGLALFSPLKHIKPNLPDYANTPIEYLGETHTLKEWAALLQAPYKLLSIRYARGKRGADLFTTPTED